MQYFSSRLGLAIGLVSIVWPLKAQSSRLLFPYLELDLIGYYSNSKIGLRKLYRNNYRV